jgi:CRISPR/Cas system CMR-associated protein Cmr5 small subunit
VGDIQINGTAMTIIAALGSGLVGAVVYMFKAMRFDHDRRLAELREDFKQTILDLRNDYQTRLNECRQDNADLKAYLNRQAGTVKESTELLRELSNSRATGST